MAKAGTVVIDLQASTASFEKSFEKATKALNSGVAQMKRSNDALKKSFDSLNQGIGFAIKGFLGIEAVQLASKTLQMADAYNSLQGQIKQATRETGDYIGVSRALEAIAKSTGSLLEDNVSTFQRLEMGAKDLGKSHQDVLKLVQAIDELGAIGRSSPEAMKAGLLQFGQAMSAGIVRAEEFNSLVENMPAVVERIAKGLGVSGGQLRKMVLDGKLLSTDVFDALLKQTKEIHENFLQIPPSMARGWNSFTISVSRLVSTLDQSLGATDKMGSFFNSLGILFDKLAGKIEKNTTNIKLFMLETERARALQGATNGGNPFGGPNGRQDVVASINRDFDRQRKEILEAAKNLKNTSVSDKKGTPPPEDPRKHKKTDAEKNAEKVTELAKALDTETEATKRLFAARQKSEDLYVRLKMLIEAENEVSGKNLKLTKEQTTAFVQQAFANKKRLQEIEAQGSFAKLNKEIDQTRSMTAAIGQGQDAVFLTEMVQYVEKAMEAYEGLSDRQKEVFRQAHTANFFAERQKELAEINHNLDEQLDSSKKLFESQKLGTVEYEKQRVLIESMNAAKSAGKNQTQEEIDKLAKRYQEANQINRSRELLAQNQGLELEISNLVRLSDARKKGIEAYNMMQIAMNAENAVRQAGLSLLSDEGQKLYELSLQAENGQYQFQKLQDEMQRFEAIGTQVSDTITGAFEQMIIQGDKFGDVLKQLALNMAKLIFQESVSKPAARGLGSLFGSLGVKLATSLLGGGVGHAVPIGPQFNISGAFAEGGRPDVGKVSLVGEKGPELFVPDRAGTIIPNGKFGTNGGQVVNVTNVFQISTGVQQTVRAELNAMMPTIEKRTVQGVQTAISRGGKMAAAVGVK